MYDFRIRPWDLGFYDDLGYFWDFSNPREFLGFQILPKKLIFPVVSGFPDESNELLIELLVKVL